MSMMEKATGITVGFMDFIIQNMLVTTIWAFLQVAIVVLFLRPNQKIDHDLILENYKKMGVMSFNEKKALFILGVIILALATESIHKIAIQYIFVIVALICFVPGVRLLKEDDISKMNFKIMFFIAGCMAIGTVASTSGAGQWLYKIFDTFMRGSQLYTFVAAWLFGLAANFLMTPLAAESAFTGSIALMAQSAGYNPIPVVYSFMWGMDQYVLPYEVSALTYIFAFGYITYKQLVLVFIPRMVIGLLYLVTICYPFWNFIIK